LLAGSAIYVRTDLVSNLATPGVTQDVKLLNGWGLAAGPTGPFWVADNHSGVSTAYAGNTIVPPTVTIPGAPGGSGSAPTGVVYNNTGGFLVGTRKSRARYLFSSEDGTISAWSPQANASQAQLVIDQSGSGAVYKGIGLGTVRGKPVLYAADFHNDRIDVFDRNYAPMTLAPGAFTDPNLPAGYGPFNVQQVKGKVYVMYAQKDAGGVDEVKGAGLGVVDVFGMDGRLQRRLASGGTLDAPWGVAVAPARFGKFGGDVLIGNFGDGKVNAFNARTGKFDGQLSDAAGQPIVVDGLWGIAFGNGNTAGRTDTLYFAAGPDDEVNGLFGKIAPTRTGTTPGTGNNGGGFPYAMMFA
jgi:uncharacterized protein (TIGR03118 family)